jgi:hypothetical protein
MGDSHWFQGKGRRLGDARREGEGMGGRVMVATGDADRRPILPRLLPPGRGSLPP